MNYNTDINWDLFLDQVDLIHNDKPIYLKNFFSNPLNLLSWLELEKLLNTQKFLTQLKLQGRTIAIPETKNVYNDSLFDKKFIITHIKKGLNFMVKDYAYYNPYLSSLCKEIDELFLVNSDPTVYGNKGNHDNSFPVHMDPIPLFIFQIEGKVEWVLYENKVTHLFSREYINSKIDLKNLTQPKSIILEPGDFLYIPSRTYHKVIPSTPRLTISIGNFPKDLTNSTDRNYYTL